jgi:hypothetical protein
MSTETQWKVRPSSKISEKTLQENFEVKQVVQKIKKIREKRLNLNNPKKIPVFEDLYLSNSERDTKRGTATSSSYVSPVSYPNNIFSEGFVSIYENDKRNKREGFDIGADILKQDSKTSAPAPAPAPSAQDASGSFYASVQDKLKNSSYYNKDASGNFDASGISHSVDDLLNMAQSLSDGDLKYYDRGLDDYINDIQKFYDDDTLSTEYDVTPKQLIESVKNGLMTISKKMRNMFLKLLVYLKLGLKVIKNFIKNWKEWFNKLTSTFAYALTHNYATDFEIKTFRDQINKFITMLLVWFFLYNWYFVIFFLEDTERYAFKFTNVVPGQEFPQKFLGFEFNSFMYAFFGPCLRAVEWINYLIVEFPARIANIWKIPKKLIFILMMFIFIIIVSANWHMMMIVDFFNSLNFSIGGGSVLILFSILVVTIYASSFAFTEIIAKWATGGWLAILVATIASALYFGIALAINIPLGVLFLTFFLVLHSFFGIMIYNGFNIFSTLRSISEDLSSGLIKPISDSACTETNEYFEITKIPNYIYNAPTHIYNFVVKVFNYTYLYLFEIAILVILLGGIAKYKKHFGEVLLEQTKIRKFTDLKVNVTKAFHHLFTWTILINVIVIILVIISMVQKYYKFSSPIAVKERKYVKIAHGQTVDGNYSRAGMKNGVNANTSAAKSTVAQKPITKTAEKELTNEIVKDVLDYNKNMGGIENTSSPITKQPVIEPATTNSVDKASENEMAVKGTTSDMLENNNDNNRNITTENEPIVQENETTAQENENEPIAQEKENETTAQENEPTAQENEPTAQENETTAQENEPTAQENEPTAQENEPTAQENETI